MRFSDGRKLSRTSIYILLILGYSLFAFTSIKNKLMPEINGAGTNNLVILIPLIVILVGIRRKFRIANWWKEALMLSFALLIVAIMSTRVELLSDQGFYAFLLLFIPILLLFCFGIDQVEDFDRIVTVLIVLNVVYSILTVVACMNFGRLIGLIGGDTNNYRYNSQYRASLMIGSAISVSYYMNITLPFILMRFYSTKSKWYLIAIALNITATLVENSRLAVVAMAIVFLFGLFKFKTDNSTTGIRKKVFISVLFVVGVIAVSRYFDVSRILSRLSSNDESTVSRFASANLGLHIFEKNPILGSGLAQYYLRARRSTYFISIDNFSGLVNPHNTQIMLLSELGLLGFIIFYSLLVNLYRPIERFKNVNIKTLGEMVFLSHFIGSLGGTHVIDEINFSCIFWIYIGLLFNYCSAVARMEEDINE